MVSPCGDAANTTVGVGQVKISLRDENQRLAIIGVHTEKKLSDVVSYGVANEITTLLRRRSHVQVNESQKGFVGTRNSVADEEIIDHLVLLRNLIMHLHVGVREPLSLSRRMKLHLRGLSS